MSSGCSMRCEAALRASQWSLQGQAHRHARRPQRLPPPAAVVSKRPERIQPSMRPLNPTDDAETVAQRHAWPSGSGGTSSSRSSSSSNGAANGAASAANGAATRQLPPPARPASAGGPGATGGTLPPAQGVRPDLVPMRYAGRQQQQQLNGARPTASTASSSNGAGSVQSMRPPAAVRPQAAASPAGGVGGMAGGSATFRRSMMVAGFEEDAASPDQDVMLATDYTYAWAQEDYSKGKRTADTWAFVLTLRARLWLLDQQWSYPGGFTPEKRSVRARALAVWIRESILQLGPTFIKVGQLFSTRSDLFPAEFTEELSKLQDRVPAFSADKAEEIIQRELGAPVGTLFRTFDRQPIAAASLGQVHLATLHTGERVVVKVQRPGLKQLFDIDLANLEKVAEQLDRGDEATRDFKGIYKECADTLYQEIDYIAEGRNADRFRRNFREQSWVKVPRVYWQYSSPSVLTLEYAPGIKITNTTALVAAGLDTPTIARRATESYLLQILRHGFFHADPHPGNIAVDERGALVFYDFGMMGEIVPATRERLLELFYAINRKDTDSVVRELVSLGIIVPTSDLLSIRRSINFFVNNINRQAQQQEAVATIGEDLFAIALDQPFRFPAAFTFVLRAFATLEGIGKALDPNFKFVTVAAPYATELLNLQDSRSQSSFVLEQLQQQAVDLGQAAAAMPMRVQKIESTMGLLESGDLKLRVRVLEAERAARRAGVIQAATINTICAMGTLNVGVQLALAGHSLPAGAAFAVSAICGGLVTYQFRRVKRLDKFEKSIKTGTRYDPNS